MNEISWRFEIRYFVIRSLFYIIFLDFLVSFLGLSLRLKARLIHSSGWEYLNSAWSRAFFFVQLFFYACLVKRKIHLEVSVSSIHISSSETATEAKS